MKRTVYALTLTWVLTFSAFTGFQVIKLVQANPIYPPETYPRATHAEIISPENKTYDTNIIPLIIVAGNQLFGSHDHYHVDGGPEIRTGLPHDGIVTFEAELNLTDGPHSIVVTAETIGTACDIVHFFIATIPVVTVLSLENKTYYTSDLMLNYTVNEPVSSVAYSLDGRKNVTVLGNTTLPRLSYGSHNIVVYAWDTNFNWRVKRNVGASEAIYFTIEEPPDPFPTSLVMASSVTLAVVLVGLGLLLYGIKRK